jgi:hypothetical protein
MKQRAQRSLHRVQCLKQHAVKLLHLRAVEAALDVTQQSQKQGISHSFSRYSTGNLALRLKLEPVNVYQNIC